ncbi:putative U6 snRNA-associated Sm-like protein LSm4 [Trypanosoma cruzi]|uniref:U6 snRNA-associated Sm-like protein LSm4 n=2 Tax=Trypanosoma cruzi TaxID=5693 RepID=Q4CT67_TRYCC|nr:U6 snRNA-associated Sm-like protein LSm4, putative [Trypanosoma cruzi]AAO85522.1 putative U6 snRNA-associated Sm-like protein LSm4 [Trypanosoma cruzi]EAN83470.1 U6 snRNA-associated Sm-like protein LSm4, putative [Trypanosoma cruzi]KAF8301556.1 U6 snRNA-associated Sm-like protein LSm4 [Trypanosoma cruzi]PWU95277.1 putative U6 snRNA-associated Sm-like protein LSm4 [Trypanosoma cruzi]|eukprot:XP_805321.1 U6 snRNA-associated Sm-like protein LSm4 [Trypanosoma cruzi strain CL Brener]
MSTKKSVIPLDVLRNCRGKVVSVELANGETINGTVMRVDRLMNLLLKQCIRTGAEGDVFWKSRESLIRGASVRNVRMDERALVMPETRAAVKNKSRPGTKKQATGGKKRGRGD